MENPFRFGMTADERIGYPDNGYERQWQAFQRTSVQICW